LSPLETAIVYATLAGSTIPLGGLLAWFDSVQRAWLEREFRHAVIAFGGGALLAAVALVLIPEGAGRLPPWATLAAFAGGGIFFYIAERNIEKKLGAGGQLLAMLLDFIPESMALGALLSVHDGAGLLLTFLIALQNFPEAFNAYRELREAGHLSPSVVLTSFLALVLLGPLAAWIGYVFLRDLPMILGAIMVFAAGGILYLTFEDIAPQAHLERHWRPPLGAVAGFMLGLVGYLLLE
jgi:ZIP family zinc transporter